jgi:hypothetical protein
MSGTPFADTVPYRLNNPNTIEGKAKKSGKVVVAEIAVLSADGRSLKVPYYSKNAAGQDVSSTAVFE